MFSPASSLALRRAAKNTGSLLPIRKSYKKTTTQGKTAPTGVCMLLCAHHQYEDSPMHDPAPAPYMIRLISLCSSCLSGRSRGVHAAPGCARTTVSLSPLCHPVCGPSQPPSHNRRSYPSFRLSLLLQLRHDETQKFFRVNLTRVRGRARRDSWGGPPYCLLKYGQERASGRIHRGRLLPPLP